MHTFSRRLSKFVIRSENVSVSVNQKTMYETKRFNDLMILRDEAHSISDYKYKRLLK